MSLSVQLAQEHQVIAPRSALRHRPIAPEGDDPVPVRVWVRASRPTTAPPEQPQTKQTKSLPAQPTKALPKLPKTASRATFRRSGARVKSWVGNSPQALVCFTVVVVLLLLWIVQGLWSWGTEIANNLQYGMPRTTQVDAFVGHETGKLPSHFVAMNLHGQVYILELPGSDGSHARILVGPRLSGSGADLLPVQLRFLPSATPAHPDLQVIVGEIQVIYKNVQGQFVAGP